MYACPRATAGGFSRGCALPVIAHCFPVTHPHRLPCRELLETSVVVSEGVIYTRSARTIRRFSKVGIGVHVCNVTMSLPLTCPITHESVGSTTNTLLTRYL
jgi:hypothetical protein